MRSTSERNDLANRLGEVPLFAATSKKQRRELARRGSTMTWREGYVAITEGEKAATFHLILDGSVSVSKAGTPLARLGPGDFVGEVSLLTNEPRSATVTATQATTVFTLGRPALGVAIKDDPSIGIRLMDAMAQRQSAAL